ncbi:MAG: hypothetical protein V2I33_17160 [Kangiellaceae bacterium]|jgi:hypothetical protein|nr:hypothetical protein [Kangiellaceae bacterium]
MEAHTFNTKETIYIADTNVGANAWEDRTVEYSLVLYPQKDIPTGGEIRIAYPKTVFTNAGAKCNVYYGLEGPVE